MCQPCIRRLNSSYEFKKQCVVSAQTWKTYLELLNESQKKISTQVSVNVSRQDVSQETVNDYLELQKEEDKNKHNAYIRVVPNQKLFKLFVGPQTSQNSFQNVFLNLIPSNTVKSVQDNNVNRFVMQNPNIKDANRNVFLNINNTFQRFIPMPQNKEIKSVRNQRMGDVNVSKILTETKTEELSVEIDPTDFGCMSEDSPVHHVGESLAERDWDELISVTKIPAATEVSVPRLVPLNKTELIKEETVEVGVSKSNNVVNNYVPILPKPNTFANNEITNEEKYEFFNGGHFLTPKDCLTDIKQLSYTCEICDRIFDTLKVLRHHIKQFHLGKFPYKCDFCFSEFATRSTYDIHREKHKSPADTFLIKETLTLQDFPADVVIQPAPPPPSNSDVQNSDTKSENEDSGIVEHACNICNNVFQSANGLVRHKVRKHNQKTKKKYFVKGMKNARCDICNRDFSTQSYLQLHKKLHLRKGPNYRGKIFKNKYAHTKSTQNGDAGDDSHAENITEPTTDSTDVQENEENEQLLEDEEEPSTRVNENVETCLSKPDHSRSLKIKINLKNLKRCSESMDEDSSPQSAEEIDLEMEMQNSEYVEEQEPGDCLANINEASFQDISLECEEYLLYQQQNSVKGVDDTDFGTVLQHTETLKANCICCKKSFGEKSNLKRYLKNIHIKSKQYKCHLCSNTFYEVYHLTKHLKIHFKSGSCTICQKMFSSEVEMEEHNKYSHNNSAFWECGVCYVVFKDTVKLKEHMLEHDSSLIYCCHLCGDEFKMCEDLSRHVAEHRGLYFCKLCQKRFGYEHEKNIHDSSIHEKNRHLCDLCNKSYKSQQEVTRHSNLHQYHSHLLHNNEGKFLDRGEYMED